MAAGGAHRSEWEEPPRAEQGNALRASCILHLGWEEAGPGLQGRPQAGSSSAGWVLCSGPWLLQLSPRLRRCSQSPAKLGPFLFHQVWAPPILGF